MDIKQIKAQLHESIENIQDDDFLLAVKEILERKYPNMVSPHLTPAQVERIRQSKTQISQGECLTNEEADQLVSEWLRK